MCFFILCVPELFLYVLALSYMCFFLLCVCVRSVFSLCYRLIYGGDVEAEMALFCARAGIADVFDLLGHVRDVLQFSGHVPGMFGQSTKDAALQVSRAFRACRIHG